MTLFIGREPEMKALHNLYMQPGFQLVVFYGRRRVGKTTLLSEFAKDKRTIYFVADEADSQTSLRRFSAQILPVGGVDFQAAFLSWDEAFLQVGTLAKAERLVLILDEFPYLCGADARIPSLLQNVIDHHWKKTQLFVVLCGSSVSFMEQEVLSEKSPLFGRRTSQIQLKPFDFFDSRKFFPHWSPEEQLMGYTAVGGIPLYLELLAKSPNFRTALSASLFQKSAYLYEEPRNLLRQELRHPRTYNAIIAAVAGGATRMNEISQKIGEKSDKTATYVATLLELQILRRDVPLGGKSAPRNSLYRVNDLFFGFWFRFVFPAVGLIEQELIEPVLQKLEEELSEYLGPVFERVCREYLWRENGAGRLPFVAGEIGSWWGNNSAERREEEIDIVATAFDSKDIGLIGECRWRNQPMDASYIQAALRKGTLLAFHETHAIFFSKTGFTPEARKMAALRSNVRLVSFADMTKVD